MAGPASIRQRINCVRWTKAWTWTAARDTIAQSRNWNANIQVCECCWASAAVPIPAKTSICNCWNRRPGGLHSSTAFTPCSKHTISMDWTWDGNSNRTSQSASAQVLVSKEKESGFRSKDRRTLKTWFSWQSIGSFWYSTKKLIGAAGKPLDERAPEHKEGYTALVRELKNAFRADNYVLSMTVLPNVNTTREYSRLLAINSNFAFKFNFAYFRKQFSSMFLASNRISTWSNWAHSIIKHGIAIHTRLTSLHQSTNWANATPRATSTSRCICGHRSTCHATRSSSSFQRTDVHGNWAKIRPKLAFHQFLKLKIRDQRAFKRKRPVYSVGQKFARNCRIQATSIWGANSNHCARWAIQQNVSEPMPIVYRTLMATMACGWPTKIQKRPQTKPNTLPKMVWAASASSICPTMISAAHAPATNTRFCEQPNSAWQHNRRRRTNDHCMRAQKLTLDLNLFWFDLTRCATSSHKYRFDAISK